VAEDILEKALEEEDLKTALNAIRAVALGPKDARRADGPAPTGDRAG
jgi:hypothetical protein